VGIGKGDSQLRFFARPRDFGTKSVTTAVSGIRLPPWPFVTSTRAYGLAKLAKLLFTAYENPPRIAEYPFRHAFFTVLGRCYHSILQVRTDTANAQGFEAFYPPRVQKGVLCARDCESGPGTNNT
jgi:hypothetical protein